MAKAGQYRPMMSFIGEGKVWVTASSTRINVFHYTILKADGSVDCTCEGFRTHRKCWHATEVASNDSDPFEGLGGDDIQVSL